MGLLLYFKSSHVKILSETLPKDIFEIVVRVERKKIPAVNVPNGVSDVPIGTS